MCVPCLLSCVDVPSEQGQRLLWPGCPAHSRLVTQPSSSVPLSTGRRQPGRGRGHSPVVSQAGAVSESALCSAEAGAMVTALCSALAGTELLSQAAEWHPQC